MSGNISQPLLIPSTERLLRGMITALDGIDSEGRADIRHVVGMLRLVVQHLIRRESLADFVSIHSEIISLVKESADLLDLPIDGGLPSSVSGTFDDIQQAVGQALDQLNKIAAQVDPLDKGFWRKTQDVERRFYAALLPVAVIESRCAPISITSQRFETYLRSRFNNQYIGLKSFTKLVGGFQKETILVEALKADNSVDAVVVRAEKNDRFLKHTASEIDDEFEIVRLMWNAGIPVAEPLWIERDASALGSRFMVSRRAPGENAGNAVGSASKFSRDLTQSFLTNLVGIHNIKVDDSVAITKLIRWMGHKTLADNTRAAIDYWRNQSWLATAPASVTFSRVFKWLEDNVPADDGKQCIVHNDFGPHNILVESGKVTAILDWENVRLGDPADDLAYFIQCGGSAIDAEDVIKIYSDLGGQEISNFRLKYFAVFSCAKVLAATLSATTMYQSTDPALIDWVQLPIAWHGMFQQQVEEKILAAEACR
ncbi:phosphotransferase family protein [Burkholderia sp. Bp9143]|uniref:phosphotransferase family protein n=1 Tax=Burkholderia sp. Bp9143 TaxID=2184574 RepID=UPI000F5B54AD|nr:phosphotransferase family protein [Burkholderia sp. Bp9143]RQR22049.1 phosphotransferase family protein [Burkholderia sp. Bp9143]